MPAYVAKHKDVLKNNERVNVLGDWSNGFFAMSFIGALNVGSINLHFDEVIKTNLATPAYPYINDKNYLLLLNQEDDESLFGNQFLKVPKHDDRDKSDEVVFSPEELSIYLNEFDVKDIPGS